MTVSYWISAVAMTLSGGAIIWFVEPETHADTAYAFGCMILTYGGAVALCVGLAMMLMNDAVERAGNRIFKL